MAPSWLGEQLPLPNSADRKILTQGALTLPVPQPVMDALSFSLVFFFAADGLVMATLQLICRRLEGPAEEGGEFGGVQEGTEA